MVEEKRDREVSEFVAKMMAEKGATDEVLREQLEMKLQEQIEQAMIRALSDEMLVELDCMLEREASDEEIETFFDESGVDFAEVVEQTMLVFREAFLNNGTEVE